MEGIHGGSTGIRQLQRSFKSEQYKLQQIRAPSALDDGFSFRKAHHDIVCGQLDITKLAEALRNKLPTDANIHPKWRLYSGLFILLKKKLRLSKEQVDTIAHVVAGAFATEIYGNVRTRV